MPERARSAQAPAAHFQWCQTCRGDQPPQSFAHPQSPSHLFSLIGSNGRVEGRTISQISRFHPKHHGSLPVTVDDDGVLVCKIFNDVVWDFRLQLFASVEAQAFDYITRQQQLLLVAAVDF
jgi:hypothetical protein